MIGRIARFAAVVSVLSLAAAVPAKAQKSTPASTYKAPRTEWGDPDLRGMWPLEVGNTRMQRDPKYGDQAWLTDAEYAAALKAAQTRGQGADQEDQSNKLGAGHWFEYGTVLRQTSLILEPANGRIPPPTPQGQAMAKASHSSWDNDLFSSVKDFNSLDRCITRGMPASMIPFPYNNGVQIFQAPGYVVLNLELIHETRIIPLDGRPAIPGTMKTWLGDSRGHWEGQTLVVETTNIMTGDGATHDVWKRAASPLNVATQGTPANNAIPVSAQARVVERFTRTAPGALVYELTYADPGVFTASWTARITWTRDDGYEFYEYACQEGNQAIRNNILATRAGRRQAAEKAGN